MKCINWGIIAPGHIANKMAQAMLKSKTDLNLNINLYAVASRDINKAKKFSEKWHFEKYYGSYKELINDPKVDAVYIANPHSFHFNSVMECLDGGKHVLCEKPAACNLNELKQMIEKAKEKNLFFMEAMWTAFNPCIKKVKEIIAQGKIGAIKHIESSFYNRFEKNLKNRFWNPDLAGGGLLDLGIYCIYYALCINNFEKIEGHSSSVRLENGVDAWNSVNFKFKNGVTTHFQTAMDISSTTNSHDAVIYGSKGFITSTNFLRQEKAEVYLYKNDKGGEFELSEEIKAPFDINGFEYQLIHATECINKGIIESDIHSFQRSIELCEIMDILRKDWGMNYPFEK